MISQIALFCFISAAVAYVVPEYGAAYEPAIHDEQPQPYSFGFNTKDEYGATINQHETGDEQGNKRGSYGYTDGYGVYRQVDYVADEHGFRATVKTNEPGTDNQSPADAEILSEAAPVQYSLQEPHGRVPAVAAVAPAYSHPAAPVAPAYAESFAQGQSHGASPVYNAVHDPAQVYDAAAPVYGPAPVYDAAYGLTSPSHGPVPVYDASVHNPAPIYDAAYGPAPASHGPAPVYEASVHAPAPVYSPAQVYDAAPVSYAHGSAPGLAAAHIIPAPVYAGPSYDQLLDNANQVNGQGSSEYEHDAVESHNLY